MISTTEKIWNDMSEVLRRFIRRRVNDEGLAEDLLQEVFLRITKSEKLIKEEEKISSWVFQITRNVIIDHWRKNKGLSSESFDEADHAEGIHHSDHFFKELSRCLHRFIEKLPSKYREAIELSELEGLSQHDVADKLSLSYSGAKSRVQRGRAMILKSLQDCCHFEFDRRGQPIDCNQKGESCS